MASEYGYKEFDASPVRLLKRLLIEVFGPAAGHIINRGLAAMPTRERAIMFDGRPVGGDQPQRQHREAMARNTSPQQEPHPRADQYAQQHWEDEVAWDEQDEAAGHQARRLLRRSNSGLHRFNDYLAGV